MVWNIELACPVAANESVCDNLKAGLHESTLGIARHAVFLPTWRSVGFPVAVVMTGIAAVLWSFHLYCMNWLSDDVDWQEMLGLKSAPVGWPSKWIVSALLLGPSACWFLFVEAVFWHRFHEGIKQASSACRQRAQRAKLFRKRGPFCYGGIPCNCCGATTELEAGSTERNGSDQ